METTNAGKTVEKKDCQLLQSLEFSKEISEEKRKRRTHMIQ